MSDRKTPGKRERGRAPSRENWWSRYRTWVAGLSRGQRIPYRCLQAATVVAVLIIVGWAILSAWIQLPDLPDPSKDGTGGGAGDVSFDGAEKPDVALCGRKPVIYTFLVAGKDVASGATDTILLLSYDTENKTIQGLNIPRDTMINTSASSNADASISARSERSTCRCSATTCLSS